MVALRVFTLFVGCGLALACARGEDGDDISDDGDAQGGALANGGAGATSTSSRGAGGMNGPSGTGGSAPACDAPEHLCGGICVGNTTDTGCYQSSDCNPCAPVVNGTTKCTSEGLCDFDCVSPYTKSGTACVCPSECCSNADCSSGASCENGQCVTPCDPEDCFATCAAQGMFGVCQGNQCFCFS